MWPRREHTTHCPSSFHRHHHYICFFLLRASESVRVERPRWRAPERPVARYCVSEPWHPWRGSQGQGEGARLLRGATILPSWRSLTPHTPPPSPLTWTPHRNNISTREERSTNSLVKLRVNFQPNRPLAVSECQRGGWRHTGTIVMYIPVEF